jgi:hypothetical protein
MNKEKTLNILQNSILTWKEEIVKCQKNEEYNRASYFNGMLEGYERLEDMIKNGYLD